MYVRNHAEAHKERLSFARNAYLDANEQTAIGSSSGNVVTPSHRAFQRLVETQKEHQEKLKRQRTQAVLFVGGFFLCNVIAYVLRGREVTVKSDLDYKELPVAIFPLLVLQAILYPLQGWVNMFVFLRPSYIRLRTSFPSESKLWWFRHTIFGDPVEGIGSTDNANKPVQVTKGIKNAEKRKTSLTANSGEGGIFPGNLSVSETDPKEQKGSRRKCVDGDEKVDPKKSLERGSSIVIMDGSIHTVRSSDVD